jgi:hypothetical protein
MQLFYMIAHVFVHCLVLKDYDNDFIFPVVAVLHITRWIISCYELTEEYQKYFATFFTLCTLYVWFGGAAYFAYDAQRASNGWILPSIMLELIAINYCGLIFWELSMILLIFLTVPAGIAEFYEWHLSGGYTSSTSRLTDETNFAGYSFHTHTWPLVITAHVMFLCLLFLMLGYWKEVQTRREFIYQQKLFNENIKFRLAANPFTAANIGHWFMEQFSNRMTFSRSSHRRRQTFATHDEVRIRTGVYAGQTALVKTVEPGSKFLTLTLKSGLVQRCVRRDIAHIDDSIPHSEMRQARTKLKSGHDEVDEFGYQLMGENTDTDFDIHASGGTSGYTSSNQSSGKSLVTGESNLSTASSLDVLFKASMQRRESPAARDGAWKPTQPHESLNSGVHISDVIPPAHRRNEHAWHQSATVSANPLAKWEVLDSDITVLDALGQGGQAKVFNGSYGTASEPIALKDLHLGHDATPEYFEAFAMETQVLSVINHPHIVKFYGICYKSSTHQLFMVSELCDGTLRDLLYSNKGDGRQSLASQGSTQSSEEEDLLEDRSVVLHICRCICSAMIYLEHKGVVHSDLKPANVLYNRRNLRNVSDSVDDDDSRGAKLEIKLCDFGLSRTRRTDSHAPDYERKSFGERRMTGGKNSVFTPYYAAPEVSELSYGGCVSAVGVGRRSFSLNPHHSLLYRPFRLLFLAGDPGLPRRCHRAKR